jgi:hypothetical protein
MHNQIINNVQRSEEMKAVSGVPENGLDSRLIKKWMKRVVE